MHKYHYLTPSKAVRGGSKGFTIIELMIATMVFSIVLLLITVGVIRFNEAYYGGLVQSSTENTARAIIGNISQAIQFGGAVSTPVKPVGTSEYYFCVGDNWYSYLPGWQLVNGSANATVHQTKHAFIENVPGDSGNPGDGCSGAGVQDFGGSVSGTELIGVHMRLANLTISQVGTTNMYKVDVRVVYGDDDLLYSPSGSPAGPAAPDAKCRFGISGSQFCAVSELSTAVQQRLTTN